MIRRASTFLLALGLAACGDDSSTTGGAEPPEALQFGAPGSLASPSGKGTFRFGAASAATQIEDQNPATDWFVFTQPTADGGLGKGQAFVGDASKGYELAIDDIALLKEMGLDTYRLSIEWARIEPVRNQIDEAALQHYSDLLDALKAAGIRPIVTVHHFSNPVWVADPRDPDCMNGVSDTNLCGFGDPEGGPQILEEIAEHAALLAERFGDRVDDWGTVNEPVNYLVFSYGLGVFPPARTLLLSEENLLGKFVPIVREYIQFHAAIYDAIKTNDLVDADEDGSAADVGLSLSVAAWVPARNNAVSEDPADVAARDRLEYVYHYLFVDAIEQGKFDSDLDGVMDEELPEAKGTMDWLGVQYYFRAGVSAQNALLPVVDLVPCLAPLDFGACVPPVNDDFTKCIPSMDYEFYEPGIYEILKAYSARYPAVPLIVSESGIATETGKRRAEHVVRSLEQIAQARDEGVDVRGYLHWSLYDNFEWVSGFVPRFGLYTVDFSTFARTATEGATTLGDIAKGRSVTSAQRSELGGTGPMTEEPGFIHGKHCGQ